jgi:hypothetical protein
MYRTQDSSSLGGNLRWRDTGACSPVHTAPVSKQLGVVAFREYGSSSTLTRSIYHGNSPGKLILVEQVPRIALRV